MRAIFLRLVNKVAKEWENRIINGTAERKGNQNLEKKFKFSENPTVAKALYGALIAILCISAIVIGIVAANNRKQDAVKDPGSTPPSDNIGEGDGGNAGNENEGEKPDDKPADNEKLSFIAPVSGRVMKGHSLTVPVFSETLEAWKIHMGIDISTDENADVFAAAGGEVTRVYSDAMLGNTVEITHEGGIKTVYSNLAADGLVTVGTVVESGAKIGKVGDSAISELADEAHLHFEMLVSGVSVNPLDYISEESKSASLGIDVSEAA